MPRVTVNGTELYYEIRGAGPPVLLIMGATGDGGHFDALADVLADEFTLVSYDRRGNGRSPTPDGWETTSPEEQADDAAGLDHSPILTHCLQQGIAHLSLKIGAGLLQALPSNEHRSTVLKPPAIAE